MVITKEYNKALCEKYPFLIPSNRWSGKRVTEAADGGYWPGSPEHVPDYDYEYTELDSMPDGWRIAFGEQLCAELKDALVKANYLDKYRITQIKEKFGALRWYDNGNTKEGYDVLSKYEALSERTCIRCGKPATKITTGWISPFCDDCCEGDAIPIDEWFSEMEDSD